jgi:hypothetical protein
MTPYLGSLQQPQPESEKGLESQKEPTVHGEG